MLGFGFWARSKGTDSRSNSCKMTFSRPEYVHLPVAGYPTGEAAGDELPGYQYRLMRYMDRALPASEKADPLKPAGVPVLFVPGHLGSYEQVRQSTRTYLGEGVLNTIGLLACPPLSAWREHARRACERAEAVPSTECRFSLNIVGWRGTTCQV